MSDNKQDLIKLLAFITELSATPNNNWFKKELLNKLVPITTVQPVNNSEISEIHEYCIKQILHEQAELFYKDFKLTEIVNLLCSDFVRMEQFRRSDNFEEFCLAMFQQIEQIVNTLSTNILESYVRENWNTYLCSWKDKYGNIQGKSLWKFIFYFNLSEVDILSKINRPISAWDFNEKYKACLVFYYFKCVVNNYKDFDIISNLIYELYQIRNLNHRGGKKTPKQVEITNKVNESKSKYYFKFLGVFEDFVTKINNAIN
jgi:hypothetical protein